MRQFFNKSNIIFILILIASYQLIVVGKDENNKMVVFSDVKESIVNYKNFESYREQNVSRVTFTDAFDEINVKASSDSKELLFEGWSPEGQMGIYSIYTNNQSRNIIFKNFKLSNNPVFDPTNKNVFFTTVQEKKGIKNGVLFWIDKSGVGGLHIVPTKNEGVINSLAISSKNEIAFSQMINNQPLVQIINLENNYHLELIGGDEINWSADGSKLVFTAKDRADTRSIFMINKDGSNLIQLTSFTEDVSSPCFSPDGNWICFAGLSKSTATTNKKEENSNWDLFMISKDELKLIQLTKDLAADKSPFWAKDGNIYFSSNRFGNYEIMKISPTLK